MRNELTNVQKFEICSVLFPQYSNERIRLRKEWGKPENTKMAWYDFLLSKKVKEVHISEISHGDTIIHLDGYLRTVCNSNIKNSEFMGITIFGDSYNLGTIKVKKIN